jgi:hypothetical protein
MTTKLEWRKGICGSREATTARGRYRIDDMRRIGSPGFAARYQPPQGRARNPKQWINLNNVDTIEKAQALCERHAGEMEAVS